MGGFISSARISGSRLLFHRLPVDSPPATPAILTHTVPLPHQVFLVRWLLYVAFWCFKRNVECDRPFIFKCAFPALMPHQSDRLERPGEGEVGGWLSPGLMNNLCSARFSPLCQECGLNSMSSLPLTFQDTCQFCCLDTWQNIDLQWFSLALGVKWYNPQLNRGTVVWTSHF